MSSPCRLQEMRPNAAMTIDIHPHVISTDTARYPNAPVGGHKSDWSRERPVSVEQMIAAMDQAGIAKSALVQASTCYGHDNSYVADAVAAHPDRFTGVFSVDVLAPDAPEKIRYWVGRKLTGMRLFTAGSTMPNQADWVDDPRSFPAWECASELGIPVCMQMTVKAIPQLMHMLERFPKVPVILDHLAKPTLSDGPPYAGASRCLSTGGLQEPVLETDAAHRRGGPKRKGHSRDLLPATRIEIRSFANRLGIELSGIGRNASGIAEGFPSGACRCLSAEDRDWIFARTALTLYPALAGK